MRLAGVLDARQRRRLALALLADVVHAASGWPLRIMVTSDADASALAGDAGWTVVADPGGGLNAALAAGTRRAMDLGADALLVLPADVPLASSEDLRSLFALDAAVVVARSDDGGTTALLRRPPDAIPPSFGPDSAAAHLAAAQLAGMAVVTVALAGLALDVDDPQDLERLARVPGGGAGGVRSSAQVARELLAGTPSAT